MGDNIILTGFMGTGKTAAGRILAGRLGREFIDTDELIVARTGRSIPDIFHEDGEAFFRALERDVASELAQQRDLVIATGGGMMVDPANATALGTGGAIFCLWAEPATILDRLNRDTHTRPLLAGDDPAVKISALLRRRAASYARFRAIQTDGQEADAVVDEIITALECGLVETIAVRHPAGQYDVVVGENVLGTALQATGMARATAVITDSVVGPLHRHRLGRPSSSSEAAAPTLVMSAGESHKNLDTVRALYDELLQAGIGRDSAIIALGGGVTGDVAGFVAATWLRGVDFVLCPTTLLAMVDSSIGGKTGVDLTQGKNLIGAFKQPLRVLADINTLSTLPAAEFTAGMAEVAKHGLIADPILWQRLANEEWHIDPRRLVSDRLLRSDLQSLVTRAIQVKRIIVEEDPYEAGRRALLNLGHTFGHAIEQVSGYAIRHGEAVAMGVAAAAHLSAALGECPADLPTEIEAVLTRLGLPIRIPRNLNSTALVAAMSADKKKKHGRLRFILIRDIGETIIRDDVPLELVSGAIAALQPTDLLN